MKRFGILLLALLWLLPNCGGKKQVVSQPEQTGPVKVEEQIALDLEDDKEEPLVGDVSSQRLEEQYGKGAVSGLDETLDQEMKKWELQKTFDMPIQVNKEVRNYIYYFSTARKDTLQPLSEPFNPVPAHDQEGLCRIRSARRSGLPGDD